VTAFPGHTEAAHGPIAGRRVHFLSVVTLSFVAVFLAAVTALIVADVSYISAKTVREVLRSKPVLAAMRLSAVTSFATLALVILFAVPMGYALSRYRFPGHVIADTMVDLPIVLPPLVIGVSLLVFFRTSLGEWIERMGLRFVYTIPGIVLCQFLVSASYGIRSAKATRVAARIRCTTSSFRSAIFARFSATEYPASVRTASCSGAVRHRIFPAGANCVDATAASMPA